MPSSMRLTQILQMDAKLSTPSVSPPVCPKTETSSTQTQNLETRCLSAQSSWTLCWPFLRIKQRPFHPHAGGAVLAGTVKPAGSSSLEQFLGTAISIFGPSPRASGGSRKAGRGIRGENVNVAGYRSGDKNGIFFHRFSSCAGLILGGWNRPSHPLCLASATLAL